MVVSNDPAVADRVMLLRNHGHRPKYYNQAVGGNFRMDALQAAIINAKFKHLENWTTARRRNAALYRKLFIDAELSGVDTSAAPDLPVVLPTDKQFGRHIYHLFQVRVPRRKDLMQYLKLHQVETEIYYPVPLHLQECFESLGYKQGSLPNAEKAAQETLALPIYPELSEEQINHVVQTIRNFYR